MLTISILIGNLLSKFLATFSPALTFLGTSFGNVGAVHGVVVVGQAHVALMLNIVGATTGALIQIIVGAKFSAFDVGEEEPIFVLRGLSFDLVLIVDFGHGWLLRLFDLWSTGYSWL